MSLSLASRLCCGVFRLVKGAVLALPVVLVVGLVAVDWYVFVVQWAIGQQHNNTTGVYALVTQQQTHDAQRTSTRDCISPKAHGTGARRPQ